jgi:hypothetical protein
MSQMSSCVGLRLGAVAAIIGITSATQANKHTIGRRTHRDTKCFMGPR